MISTAEPARYTEEFPDDSVSCHLCPRECFLRNSQVGVCGVRRNSNGRLVVRNHGIITSTALDPVEKKPLYHYFPGRKVFSLGGWGCNLRCAFCQNSPISQFESPGVPMTPREVAREALKNNSIGAAYTYNEPIVEIEFVMECCKEVRKLGGKNILVTNGYINPEPLADLLPLVDAANIDIKAFNEDFYERLCSGSLEPVLQTVRTAAKAIHIELTTLLIPRENDAAPELEDLSSWIEAECGPATPCHLTAYHPSYKYTQAAPTPRGSLLNAWRIFKRRLANVYIGNMVVDNSGDTVCPKCGAVVVSRQGYVVDTAGMSPRGQCAACGADVGIKVK